MAIAKQEKKTNPTRSPLSSQNRQIKPLRSENHSLEKEKEKKTSRTEVKGEHKEMGKRKVRQNRSSTLQLHFASERIDYAGFEVPLQGHYMYMCTGREDAS
jgi:hypothetical protein